MSEESKVITFRIKGSQETQKVAIRSTDPTAEIEATLKKLFSFPSSQDFVLQDDSGVTHVLSGPNLCSSSSPSSFSLLPLSSPSSYSSSSSSFSLAPLSFPPRPTPGAYDETERKVMLRGEMYLPSDPLLVYERERCRVLLHSLNHSSPVAVNRETGVVNAAGGMQVRREIYKELFLATASEAIDTIVIEPPFTCDYGSNIQFGANVYINFGACFLDCNWIKIGSNTLIAPNVSIFPATHPLTPKERNSGREYALSVTIGENCWLGGNSVIIPGVKIGNNVVVGAGTVVTKDVPDNCVVVGNPARILKRLDL